MVPRKPPSKPWTGTPVRAAGVSVVVFFMAQLDSIRPAYAQWDKAAHVVCFFATWWVFHRVLGMGRGAAFLLAAALGAFIEVHQIGQPSFDPSWSDFFADLAGIAGAWSLSLALPARKDPP